MGTKGSLAVLSLMIVALVLLGAQGAPLAAGPPDDVPVIEVAPVHGVTIRPGVRLWVFVFPERGKGQQSTSNPCTDTNTQNLYGLLGFILPGPLTFKINDGSIPIDKTAADTAIRSSFATWENAVAKSLFAINSTGGASGPGEDGNNTVGWVYIVPRNTLAAAWIWTTVDPATGAETVSNADIFYNLFHKWGAFSVCNEQDRFEVQSVGTHEVGHVIGLAHVSDTEAMATMYPSAAKGEVKKQTLTTGDISGARTLTFHIP